MKRKRQEHFAGKKNFFFWYQVPNSRPHATKQALFHCTIAPPAPRKVMHTLAFHSFPQHSMLSEHLSRTVHSTALLKDMVFSMTLTKCLIPTLCPDLNFARIFYSLQIPSEGKEAFSPAIQICERNAYVEKKKKL